jgi:hypothetical protein
MENTSFFFLKTHANGEAPPSRRREISDDDLIKKLVWLYLVMHPLKCVHCNHLNTGVSDSIENSRSGIDIDSRRFGSQDVGERIDGNGNAVGLGCMVVMSPSE